MPSFLLFDPPQDFHSDTFTLFPQPLRLSAESMTLLDQLSDFVLFRGRGHDREAFA